MLTFQVPKINSIFRRVSVSHGFSEKRHPFFFGVEKWYSPGVPKPSHRNPNEPLPPDFVQPPFAPESQWLVQMYSLLKLSILRDDMLVFGGVSMMNLFVITFQVTPVA